MRRVHLKPPLSPRTALYGHFPNMTEPCRVNRALACLTDELNTTPAHMPGDPPPITYQLAT